MSRTYEIACTQCKEALWIGQKPAGGQSYLYFGEEYNPKLQKFLFEHISHPLVFNDSELIPDDCETIE